MNKSIDKQLADLFAAHDAKKEKIHKIKTEREEKEATFLSEFLDRRAKVFRPAFESFAEKLKERGIECRIEEKEDKRVDQHQTQPASITITFVVGDKGYHQIYEYPHLTVSCEKHSGMVTLYKSTLAPGRGGQGGPAGNAKIGEVTEVSLHQSLVEILQQVLL